MNRESIQRHEVACKAKREESNPTGPVERRIIGKRPPGPDYDGMSNNTAPKDVMVKKNQKRGDMMAKKVPRRSAKRKPLPLTREHSRANTAGTVSLQRSMKTRARKLHGRNGPKVYD